MVRGGGSMVTRAGGNGPRVRKGTPGRAMQHWAGIFVTRIAPGGNAPQHGRAAGLVLVSLALAALVSAAGCGPPPDKSLANSDPSGKIPAIKKAVRAHDLRAAPQLVKDLESDDAAVRMYSIEALRRLTGQEFGYRYYDDED